MEDPETGELIPSAKKPGRKPGSNNISTQTKKKDEPDYKLMYETIKKESDKKDAVIKKLESQNKFLRDNLERLKEMITSALKE